MSEPIDYFFTPTGPSWLPDRSPKARRAHAERERERLSQRPAPEPSYPYDPPGPLPWRGSGPREDDPDLLSPDLRPADAASLSDERRKDVWANDLAPRAPGERPPAPEPPPITPLQRAALLLREVATPEVRRTMDRLLPYGHQVMLRDELDERHARLLVRLRPAEPPLRAPGRRPPDPARFELRVVEGSPDPADRTGRAGLQVLAGYVPGPTDPRFLPLGRVPAGAVTCAWVGERLVEFVERVLLRP